MTTTIKSKESINKIDVKEIVESQRGLQKTSAVNSRLSNGSQQDHIDRLKGDSLLKIEEEYP